MARRLTRRWGIRGAILVALLAFGVDALAAGAAPLDRVQLHRNASRAVPYLPLGGPADPPGEPALAMTVVRTIELDGDPLQNAYAGLRPLDVDGDGTFELVQYNGFRWMQVWDGSGRKLWRVANPTGRLHDFKAGTHRDSLAVLDLDGDGRQDIAHCWVEGGRRYLLFRRGADGAVIRRVPLEGTPQQECQIAAFRMAPAGEPLLLVAHALTAAAKGSCPRNFVGNWARTVAFDLQGRRLWERDTCDAGHYAWPLDEDQDGLAEAVFVGKYLLRADGTLQCRLDTWPAADHVDGLAVGELDAARPGLEAVAVGLTGTAMFSAATCRQIWRLPKTLLRNPQHLALARLDPSQATPLIVVDEKGVIEDWKTTILTAQGTVVARNENDVMPMQNADLDGARGLDEKVGSWGRVIDRFGNLRLDRDWYWNLKGTGVAETTAGFYPEDYDRWQAFPLVFDFDRDGRDDIVQWGQSLIVVGAVPGAEAPPVPPEAPPPPLSPEDSLRWLRYVASYPDLIASLGADASKGAAHFAAQGEREGRTTSFDPAGYLERNPWLKPGLGTDLAAASAHYITTGYAKGYTWSDAPLRWLRYIASHADLIQRFGTLPSGGELHWYATGKAEGRGVTFDPKAYLGRTPAARAACGVNLLCATRHHIAAARTG